MIHINYTEKDVNELNNMLFLHPQPIVQKRILAVLLKSHGLPHSKICDISMITEKSLTTYLKKYRDGGIVALTKVNFKGKVNELKMHTFDLEKYFIENPIRSSKEAKAIIEEKTGIKRSLTQVRNFLKYIGLKYLKVGHVPGKSTGEEKIKEQEDFIENELNPAIKDGQEGKCEVFFWMHPTSFTELF